MERLQKRTLSVKSLKQGRAFFVVVDFAGASFVVLPLFHPPTRPGGIESTPPALHDHDDGAKVPAGRGEGSGGAGCLFPPAPFETRLFHLLSEVYYIAFYILHFYIQDILLTLTHDTYLCERPRRGLSRASSRLSPSSPCRLSCSSPPPIPAH